MSKDSRDFIRLPAFWLLSLMVHRPGLIRLVGRVLRRWKWLEDISPAVTRLHVAAQVFRRDASFSNTSHAPNLVAGEFAIGMESGPRHAAERDFLEQVLPGRNQFRQASADESRERIARLRLREPRNFNVVDDYMVWVTWAALRTAFGAAGSSLPTCLSHAGDALTDEAARMVFFRELRYLGAHLVGGASAPAAVQARAEENAASLQGRVDSQLDQIRCAWHAPPVTDKALKRNAMGLMWVGHPAATQSGALIVQELLARPRVHFELQQRARALGDAVWNDDAFRSLLRSHVLELMRFRPPFPILVRDVPRDTEVWLDDKRRLSLRAGSSVALLGAAAMFDPAAVAEPERYWPGRDMSQLFDMDDRWLLFGLGPRSCIAKEQVLEILVSAVTGLLLLRVRWADPWYARIRYDGPIISRMQLAFTRD